MYFWPLLQIYPWDLTGPWTTGFVVQGHIYMYRWMDGQINECMEIYMNGWMGIYMMAGWIEIKVDGLMDGNIFELMDREILDGWMEI